MHRSPVGLKGACTKMIGGTLMSVVPAVSYVVTSAISVSFVYGSQLLPTCVVISHLYGGGEAQCQSQYLRVKSHCFGTCLTLQ